MNATQLSSLLHGAGLDAYTHPQGYSGEDWNAYREKIATYLIEHGVVNTKKDVLVRIEDLCDHIFKIPSTICEKCGWSYSILL